MEKVKEGYTHENLVERISLSAENFINQGCTVTRTNIDVDTTVGMKCLEAALEVKKNTQIKLICRFVRKCSKGQ